MDLSAVEAAENAFAESGVAGAGVPRPRRGVKPAVPAAAPAPLAHDVAREVVRGTSALGISVVLERGASFLANILAARFAGVMVFGAYSLGVSTANNIATYAAGGIGTTAARFSGRYPYAGGSYGVFARAMTVVALVSASLAALALLLGAGPIAALLHKPELTGMLRWAALSAAGMIVLECARGFFVGQQRIRALVVLSLMVGGGMLLLVPAMALGHEPRAMLVAQGSTTLLAVLACAVVAAPLRLMPQAGHGVGAEDDDFRGVAHVERGVATGSLQRRGGKPFRAVLREVWSYGLIQLTGLLTANLAGWWVTILIARGDRSLVQMGFFAVASQLRNLAGMVPGLLTEGSFATMAAESAAAGAETVDAVVGAGEAMARGSMPHRLMAVCTFAATSASMLFAAVGIVLAPWVLRLMYGQAYRGASLAVAVGLAVAVLQMGNAPTSARVSIVSIRSTAAINTTWAVLTASLGLLLLWRGGGAAGAMAIFLTAHVVMAVQVMLVLRRRDRIPPGMVALLVASTATMLLLCGLAAWQAWQPRFTGAATAAMLLVIAVSAAYLRGLARRHGWLAALPLRALLRRITDRVPYRFARVRRTGAGETSA